MGPMVQIPVHSVPAPALNIPASSNTVNVRVLDTTAIKGHPETLFEPTVGGKTSITWNTYAFLVENPPKPLLNGLASHFKLTAEKGVSQILEGEGVQLRDINSIIWSHWHFDHIGDPSTFPPSTSLIVGPGMSAAKLPPYPRNPEGHLVESDFEGRDMIELDLSHFSSKLGNFPVYDLFGDSSFYLLNAPGHAVGHLCGLARTTPDSFILMGADACHHGGEYRPSQYLPLPETITPNPFNVLSKQGCPGHVFKKTHPNPEHFRTQPFYQIRVNEDGTSVANDVDEANRCIGKLQEFDVADNVFIICTHDPTLIEVIDIFPKLANDWKFKGWKEGVRWKFLADWDVDESF